MIKWREILYEVPPGWNLTFIPDLIDNIADFIERYDLKDSYEVLQIKEKYGELRWYAAGIPDELYEEHEQIITYYTKVSICTCVVCGKRTAPYENLSHCSRTNLG